MKLLEQVLVSYIREIWTLTRWSSALCLVEVSLMPSSLFASCRRSTSQLTNYFTSLLYLCQPWESLQSSFKEGAMVCLKGITGSRNELCVLSKACTPMPGVRYGSMVSTVMSLAWELICIKALSLAHYSSFLCWRCLHVGSGVPWELLHADELVLIADTQENCIYKLKAWKTGTESKGPHINMRETKFLVSGVDHDVLKKSGKYPCASCSSGVGNNSIQCSQCVQWVHKKCSGITKWLVANSNYVCRKCKGGDRPINGRTVTEVDVYGTMLDVEATFCYLGDILRSGARCCVTWGKLRKVLSFLTTRYLSPSICGKVHDACVHRNNAELQRYLRNDRAMIRWICSMKDNSKHPQVHF